MPGAEPVGGVEVSSVRLAAALADAGAQVSVVAPGATSRSDHGAVRTIHVEADGRLSLLRALRPWRAAVDGALAELGPDLVHGQGLLTGGLAATDFRGGPRVVTAHGSHAMDTRAARRGPAVEARIALAGRLTRLAVSRADAVVSVHPTASMNVPGRPRRFTYIPNIVDDVFFGLSETRRVPGRVVYCGGDRAIKGIDLLAEAWPLVAAAVAGATLELVGWPENVPLPDALHGATVSGWLDASELRDAFARAAAVVIPSRFEVAPVTLYEAWSARVPVVATCAGGIPGLAEGAATLVEVDARAIADGLIAVIGGAEREPGSQVDTFVTEGSDRSAAAAARAVAAAHLELYGQLLG